MRGHASIDSPLPVREKPVVPEPQPKPPDPEPPKVEPEPLPPVEAPVVAIAANDQTRPGRARAIAGRSAVSRILARAEASGLARASDLARVMAPESVTARAAARAEARIGLAAGSSRRRLLKEVKPDYSEEARRRGIEGDVVMEIVVRHDGSVGDVRVLQGLGHGLDERAIAAVRRWRFAPATRQGSTGGRARGSGDGVQASVRNQTMTALLVVVTFGALGVASALLFYVLRLTREERDRSDARAAALTELIGEGGSDAWSASRSARRRSSARRCSAATSPTPIAQRQAG